MRITPTVLIGGVAVAALVGFAAGELLSLHTLTVRLPGGGVEKIVYSGRVPPNVAADPAPDEMDHETASLLQQVDALQAHAIAAPDGARSYSFVSSLSSAGLCTRSIEVTSLGAGHAPRVVTHASGDCGGRPAAPRTVTRALVPAPAPAAPALQTATFTPAEKPPTATKVAATF